MPCVYGLDDDFLSLCVGVELRLVHDLADVVRVYAVDCKRDDAVVVLRLVRAEHVHMRYGQHTCEGVDRQIVLALLDGVKADALQHLRLRLGFSNRNRSSSTDLRASADTQDVKAQ